MVNCFLNILYVDHVKNKQLVLVFFFDKITSMH